MRLTPKGLLRWYAACCQTPIGNTAITREIPFVGLICFGFDPASVGVTRNEVLGPVRAHVNTAAAKPDEAGRKVRTSGVLPSILRFAGLVLQARWRGEQKVSLFFDPNSREPSVTPHVLTAEELREVERRRDAA